MIKRICLTVICFFLASFAFAENGDRIYENSGNFSYCPPLGWSVTEISGLKYKVVVGPSEGNFTPNINFVDEEYNGNLISYVSTSLTELESIFPGYKLLSRSPFNTDSGIKGEQVIISITLSGVPVRSILFILPISNRKYMVITCTIWDSAATGYLPIFEQSIKTFELIK